MKQRTIDPAVLAVLSAGHVQGTHYYLPDTQLQRPLYDATNKVLAALGGKWSRTAKAHVFATDCAERIEDAIETGLYDRPQDMGWFPTPALVADMLVARAEIQSHHEVLEPSAGDGALVHAVANYHPRRVDMVELDAGRADMLSKRFKDDARLPNYSIYAPKDFLTVTPQRVYDRVVMNPPFAKRADIHHVNHALKFLRPGGVLVAIMAGSIVWRHDALTMEMRRRCDVIERLPEGAFKTSGTNVNTAWIKVIV